MNPQTAFSIMKKANDSVSSIVTVYGFEYEGDWILQFNSNQIDISFRMKNEHDIDKAINLWDDHMEGNNED